MNRAWRYEQRLAVDALREVEVETPDPGPNDVVIDIAAVALNFRDLAIARGDYHVGVAAPLIPLSDGAGRVTAVGARVRRVVVGDLACPLYMPDWRDGEITPATARRRLGGPTDGVLRQRICVNEQELVRAPSHLSAREAACLPVSALTAWHSLYVVGRLRAGDTVLVQGGGGVSMAAIQFARAGGARVISVVRSSRRERAVRAAGAHDVVVASDPIWADEIMALTDRRGADVVIDVGGAATLAESVASAAVGGQIHLVGYASGHRAEIDLFDAIRHAVTLSTARGGHRASFEAMIRALSTQDIRPVIDSVFPVEEVAAAFRHLESGGPLGKIVIDMGIA